MLIAVTGGRGIVGRVVVDELLAHGHRVRALIRTPWPNCPPACEKVEGLDLTDFDGVMAAFKGCDGVVHIANQPNPGDDNRPDAFVNNVTVNFNVLMACGLLGIDRLAIAGSNCAGGYCRNHNFPDPPYFPMDEESPCRPDDTYGISKVVSELAASRLCQRFTNLRAVTLRISRVVDESYFTPQEVREYWEKPMQRYYSNLGTYVDARDCAAAFRLAVEVPFDKVPAGAHVYYICHHETRCITPAKEFLAKEFPNVPLKTPLGDRDALESAAKANRELGWQPRYTLHGQMLAHREELGF